ncbi:XrtA/PEP-CTERM system TPR-repeat protein PrsT [Scleromatobacter humisilvae]|uniref:PEP-CTERM system TPR-repeat protein PrsT n=1 Tax=Scleromatobacter humisilvae TaxID=2897159 RepID=A0A9X1YK59_9BURK|nr:XrtA/PEP-CTERM system TPR-repeat protein PrsT [Scleromatobacter humisilvae]MCK9686380.1 PEP-CTERM system TPR-repeat protein PrsT [Scleromatobacter humisilvae]
MKNKAAAATFAVLVASCLVGCGNKSPEAFIASAKASMAKKDDKTAIIQIKNALQADPNSGEARFLLGSMLLDQGYSEVADVELHKADALHYSPDLVVPKLAAVMLARGYYKKVIETYATTKLGQPASMADLQTSLAYAYAMQDQRDLSDAALKAALAAVPDFEPALIAQARFVARSGDPDGAIALAGKVLQRDPRNADALRLQGDVHMYLKSDPDQALADYRKALEIDPASTPVHLAILSILMSQHKTDEAETQLAQMRKVTGNTAQAIYIDALIAYARKNNEKAHQLTEQLLKVAPNSPSILLLAGGVELQSGSLVQAQTYLEHAVRLTPGSLTARRMLITAFLRSSQPEKALAALQPYEAKGSLPPELYSIAAEVYLQNGDLKTAEKYFDATAKQDPSDASARTSLALAHMIDGQAPQAFEELQGIAASDKGTTADSALISAYMKRGDYDSALHAIDALERKDPGRPVASDLRGRIQLAKNNPAEARRNFEKALALSPNYFPAVANLAALDVRDNKLADARKRLEAYSAANPKSGAALMALALLPGTSSDAAIGYLGKAIAANPSNPAPRILLSDLYLAQKNTRMAGTTAQDAVAAMPDQPELLQLLSRVQLQSGEANQAVATLAKAVQLEPHSPEALVRLADTQMQAGNKDDARESLHKALLLRPDLIEAQRKLMALDANLGNVADAQDIARTVQRQRPKEGVGFAMEGDLAASRKDWGKAVSAYRASLKLTPVTDVAVKLDSVLTASGAGAEAIKFEADWRAAHSGDATFLFHLGDVALGRKDYASAESSYAAVIKLQPSNAAAFNNLAWVASLQNKPAALEYARKANELAPDQPAFMDTLAVILGAAGQLDKAIELQKKAVAQLPANDDFKLDLARLYLKAGNKAEARVELDKLAALGNKFAGQAEVINLRKDL